MLVPLLALLQVAGGGVEASPEVPVSSFPKVLSSTISDPEVYSGTLGQLDVAVPRQGEEIEVDGVLDETPWADAAMLTGFSQ